MRLRKILNLTPKTSIDETTDPMYKQKVDSSKRTISDGEMYSELLTMNMFANYYPHVFPDHSMFR
jgi:hypothetical protein